MRLQVWTRALNYCDKFSFHQMFSFHQILTVDIPRIVCLPVGSMHQRVCTYNCIVSDCFWSNLTWVLILMWIYLSCDVWHVIEWVALPKGCSTSGRPSGRRLLLLGVYYAIVTGAGTAPALVRTVTTIHAIVTFLYGLACNFFHKASCPLMCAPKCG